MFNKNKKHKGQRGFVYEVKAQVSGMVMSDRELGAVTVSFCRGRRRTESEEAEVEDGMVAFEEPLEGMMVTLYKGKKATAYDPKEYKFVLEEDGKRIGVTGPIDMAEYLTPAETKADTLELQLTTMNGVETAGLMIDLSWGFLKEVCGPRLQFGASAAVTTR